MLRTLFSSTICILTLLVASGCGSDPSGVSGTGPDGGSLPSNAQHAPSSNVNDYAAVPPSQPGQTQAVPGQPVVGSGGLGSAGSPAQGSVSVPPNVAQPTSWLSYTNEPLKFSISYPDVYVASDQGHLPQDVPNLVHRVRFQDKALASSPTANLQPAQFMIDVFENNDGLVLEDWIAANERRAAPAEAIVGNASGYVVSLQTLQAPNQFYFASHGQYIYRLVPLGEHSNEMLRSFTLG